MLRRVHPIPPCQFQFEATELLSGLSLEDLHLLRALLTKELDAREGRQKYQLPAQTAPTLN